MPIYEFRCQECARKSTFSFSYTEYDSAQPACRYCNSQRLKRLISRVALAKSEEARMDALSDESLMAGLDEEDPRALGQFMRKMSGEMGEDLGEEFDEVVDRLEKGQSPEDIEQAMPDLADGDGGGIGGDSFGGLGDDF
jgi:putative FmdB family regulatory protein